MYLFYLIEKYIEHPYSTLLLQGEVDASNSVSLDEAITELVSSGAQNILIDGSQLEYISSAGLGVFISHLDDLKAYGGKFVFYGMNVTVYNVFEILGLHTIMEIVRDRFEAQTLMNEG